jgi:hypothetical protein
MTFRRDLLLTPVSTSWAKSIANSNREYRGEGFLVVSRIIYEHSPCQIQAWGKLNELSGMVPLSHIVQHSGLSASEHYCARMNKIRFACN